MTLLSSSVFQYANARCNFGSHCRYAKSLASCPSIESLRFCGTGAFSGKRLCYFDTELKHCTNRRLEVSCQINSNALSECQELTDAQELPATSIDIGSSASVETRFWKWKTYTIRYQVAGSMGPALILIHGFGANCDHWRKNIPVLAQEHRVYAIDLLGYGYADKPSPKGVPPKSLYTFEQWAEQVLDFCSEIVQDSVFLICNSVGGVVGLQAAVFDSKAIRGLVLFNISLRMLHVKKQRWYLRPLVKAFQITLRNTDLGKWFFKAVATHQSVKRILCQCYHDNNAVTDELVEKILLPGLEPGAVDVFLDFICYSGGPLPEEMLPDVKCPVLIGWGEKDPWEPVDIGRLYGSFECVEEFIVFPNVGHCPQDEAPQLVNPVVEQFIRRHNSIS